MHFSKCWGWFKPLNSIDTLGELGYKRIILETQSVNAILSPLQRTSWPTHLCEHSMKSSDIWANMTQVISAQWWTWSGFRFLLEVYAHYIYYCVKIRKIFLTFFSCSKPYSLSNSPVTSTLVFHWVKLLKIKCSTIIHMKNFLIGM